MPDVCGHAHCPRQCYQIDSMHMLEDVPLSVSGGGGGVWGRGNPLPRETLGVPPTSGPRERIIYTRCCTV